MQAKALYAAFKQLNAIVPSESQLRIHDEAMSCVRIVCDGKQTTIAAYNLDGRWKRIVLPPEPTTFEVLCPFYLAKKWLRAVARTCEQVWIQAIATGIEFTGDTFRYTFSAPGVERYPVMPDERRSPVVAPASEPKDAIVPFTRPIRIHPEVGTLEPATSEALEQLNEHLSGAIEPIMPEYAIDIEQIKQAVAISLRPDQAFELVSGISKVILLQDFNPSEFDLTDRYCLIHAAQVEGRDADFSQDGFKSLKLSPDFAPGGSILGYGVITGFKKYDRKSWAKDKELMHPHREDLDVWMKLNNLSGDLYAVIIGKQKMLSEPVFNVSGEMRGFWSPETPYEAAAFRSAFEADRPVVDVEREELEMSLI